MTATRRSPKRPPRPTSRLPKTPKPEPPRRPPAVAITGAIGAGKTAALHAFERHGAAVISSDEIVHALLRDDEDVKRELVARLGDGILDEAGQIDRSAVASIVFADRDALAWLEALLHPRVVLEYLAWRDNLASSEHPPPLTVTEVPLLYEAGGEGRFDAVVVVTAPLGLRKARRDAPIGPRDQRFLPDRDKVRRADFAYVNDGTLEELDAFVAGVVDALTKESHSDA
jgi:dephospho-CoA kinase